MAKKVENKGDKETNKNLKPGIKDETASRDPKKSGKVKGPMGVGKKEKSQTTAKVKARSKTGGTAGNTSEDKKENETVSRKKTTSKAAAVPKRNSVVSKEDKTTNKQFSEEKKEEIPETVIRTKERLSEENKGMENKTAKSPAKKMSRRKADPEISAEEKMKLPNTSVSDDLKDATTAVVKKLKDKVLPDENIQREIEKATKEFLPNKKKARKKAKEIAENIIPDPETVTNIVDKIFPEEEDKETSKTSKKSTKATTNPEKSTSEKPVEATLISAYDVHLFKEGKHFHLYKKLGSHLMEYLDTKGVYFAVWAPNAIDVSVIGDFNEWDKQKNPMVSRQDESGIWEVFIPEAKNGSIYKYFIRSNSGYEVEKGDPYAFLWENPPNTASVVWDLKSTWNDNAWMEQRKKDAEKAKPVSVYELHIGSWRRVPEENSRSLTYKELAEQLPAYLQEMGFTHVEFMPVMEHPFFGSWGYQVTGYFAPSSRFGNPQDFMQLIDALHQAGIGVILDWVPSHFPGDLHGLHYFDGTFLYEHADPQKGFHPDWQSYIFNYGRNEVRSFLISNAVFWLDKFHADGLRVDAVASMLYLDYSRKEGEWQPNEQGGRENLEAIGFLKEFNEVVYSEFPDIITIAEESTAWPMVSRPTYMGGLGFGMKWMMGWMHDTLEYFKKDPIHRKHHQNVITFSTNYAFSENFMLPLSHDEVVYGKEALINKMPGDPWNKFANLRSLYAYMYAHPGTKLLFMGAEFGQTSEWNHDSSLDWHLTNEPLHKQLQETLKKLNFLYISEPALYEKGFETDGFEWIDINDTENSVISFIRKGKKSEDTLLIICNLTPVVRENYRIGVPEKGNWKEIFNSDDEIYGGSNVKNNVLTATEVPVHHKDYSVALILPPMAVVYLKRK